MITETHTTSLDLVREGGLTDEVVRYIVTTAYGKAYADFSAAFDPPEKLGIFFYWHLLGLLRRAVKSEPVPGDRHSTRLASGVDVRISTGDENTGIESAEAAPKNPKGSTVDVFTQRNRMVQLSLFEPVPEIPNREPTVPTVFLLARGERRGDEFVFGATLGLSLDFEGGRITEWAPQRAIGTWKADANITHGRPDDSPSDGPGSYDEAPDIDVDF